MVTRRWRSTTPSATFDYFEHADPLDRVGASPWELPDKTQARIEEGLKTTEQQIKKIDRLLHEVSASEDDADGLAGNLAVRTRLIAAWLEGLDSNEIAYLLGFSDSNYKRALHGELRVQRSKQQRLDEVAEIVRLLSMVLEARYIGDWFRTEIPALNGRTPMQSIRKRQGSKVLALVRSYLDPSYA